MNKENKSTFIQLKDLSFSIPHLVAVGKMPIPATMQTPAYYAVSIWLKDLKEPLIITYATEDEREAEYQMILSHIERVELNLQ